MEVNNANSMRKSASLEEIKEMPQSKENDGTNDEYERQKLKIKNYEAELYNQNRNTIKLSAKLDSIVAEQKELLIDRNNLKEKLESAHAKEFHAEIERKKLKLSQSDLGRQICCLLKEVETLRFGVPSDGTSRQDEVFSTASDVITKKLVEFKSVDELQKRNEKLLMVVRDLAPKLEDAETFREETEIKLQKYTKIIQSLQKTVDQQNDKFASLIPKYEHYKKMNLELQNKFNEAASKLNNASSEDQRRNQNLEQQLRNEREQHKLMEEHYKHCIQDKENNERLMNMQFDSMQNEVLELTSKNTQLLHEVENFKEQINLQDEDISAYKQRITLFEDGKKNYVIKIGEHEQAAYRLNDELMKAQRNLAVIEREVFLLRDENSALKCEERKKYLEQQNPPFSKKLETIKATLERLETECRSRLETRLDETERELSALRRRFQEEKGRHNEANLELMQQVASATEELEEERRRANHLRAELLSVHEDIALKTNQIDDANNLKSLAKKYAELESNLEEAKLDNILLSNQLAGAREHADKFCKMLQKAEVQIKKISADSTARTAQTEAQINELKVTIINLKSKIKELEAKVQLAEVASQKERAEPEGDITHLNSLNSSLNEQIETLTRQLSTQSQTLTKPGKYRELSQQVNTLKDISTANKILLAKRDYMVLQMKHLNKKVIILKKELILMRKKNGQLKAQIKQLSAENTSLRNGKWENALIEKNWENCEEFKQHQTKYENLGEKLLKEKELLKRKNEEVYNLIQGMFHRETKIASLEKQIDVLKDERRNAENDQKTLQERDVKRLDEILHLRAEILRKETLVHKLTEKLELNKADLEKSISKESVIRKIARRYRTKFTELQKNTKTVSTRDCGISTESFELSGSNTDSDSNCAQTPANNEIHENRSTTVGICGSTDTERHQKDIPENEFAAALDNNKGARGVSTEESKKAVGKNEKEGMGKQLASTSSATKQKSVKRTPRRASRASQAPTDPESI